MNEIKRLEEHGQLQFFQAEELIRPDINIGRWAGWLFSSPWAKDLDQPKSKLWEVPMEGQVMKGSITITPAVDSIRPTLTSMRVFYGLIRLWQEAGMPSHGRVHFSDRILANVIGWSWSGANTAEKIYKHIRILKSSQIY